MLKNTEKELLNISIVKNYLKLKKQTNKLRNVNEKLEKVLNIKGYIDHKMKAHKNWIN